MGQRRRGCQWVFGLTVNDGIDKMGDKVGDKPGDKLKARLVALPLYPSAIPAAISRASVLGSKLAPPRSMDFAISLPSSTPN